MKCKITFSAVDIYTTLNARMVRKALLIGINYKGSKDELRGCINDVNTIRDILIKNCGYNASNIRILTEEQVTKPTRQNIESSITWLVSNAMAGDSLFFYYSGHGAFIKDTSGDESEGNDEVIVPLDYEKQGVITDDWMFANMVCKVPASVTLWAFTDCCHSGTMLDLKYNYKSLCDLKTGKVVKGMPYNPTEWSDKFSFSLEKSKDIIGTTILFSGCQDKETSADALLAGKFQGAFSYCLIQFLKNNMVVMSDGTTRFRNGSVKVRNVLKEINCRLDINGFNGQNSQLSLSTQADLERTLDL
jgi:hypothetical protein